MKQNVAYALASEDHPRSTDILITLPSEVRSKMLDTVGIAAAFEELKSARAIRETKNVETGMTCMRFLSGEMARGNTAELCRNTLVLATGATIMGKLLGQADPFLTCQFAVKPKPETDELITRIALINPEYYSQAGSRISEYTQSKMFDIAKETGYIAGTLTDSNRQINASVHTNERYITLGVQAGEKFPAYVTSRGNTSNSHKILQLNENHVSKPEQQLILLAGAIAIISSANIDHTSIT